MKIIVTSNTGIQLKEDEEETPFDKKKFDSTQKTLSHTYKKEQAQQMKLKNEILEEAIIDFWESIE